MKHEVAAWQMDGDMSPAAPALHLVPGADAHRSLGAAWIMQRCDRLFAATSLVGTAPVLDFRAFAWTCALRRRWLDVAEEAGRMTAAGDVCPIGHPMTADLLGGIPDMVSARFEVIEPGVRATRRPRAGRAVLTCQLGLTIPRDGDLRLRVGGRMVRWAEGETLLFDETQADAMWNDGAQPGLVLSVRLKRPLRQPGRWLADRMLRHR